MPGAYLVLALAFGAAPRLLSRVPLKILVALASLALAAGAAGIGLGFRPYPFTDVVIAVFCVAAGTAVGRALPARRRPMAVLLAILASLDAIQVLATAPDAALPPGFRIWTMFLLTTPFGSSAIGFADLAVVAAIGEHWHRRGGSLAWSVLPGVVGLALADAFSALAYSGTLPLLPFVLVGWLVVEAAASRQASISLAGTKLGRIWTRRGGSHTLRR